MFDKLVESGIRARTAHGWIYFVCTSVIYCIALLTATVAAVVWFNPGLAEAVELKTSLAPPVAPRVADAPTLAPRPSAPPPGFFTPRPDPPSGAIVNLPVFQGRGHLDIGPTSPYGGGAIEGGIPAERSDPGLYLRPAPMPPPVGTPTPTPAPTPSPETRRVSERVLQGSAVNRVTPPYPDIAKRTRTQGAVRVLVTISEQGRVMEASVVDGNPLLRSAALEAARRWVFTPTLLGNTPVKVQGVLTFNFVLD